MLCSKGTCPLKAFDPAIKPQNELNTQCYHCCVSHLDTSDFAYSVPRSRGLGRFVCLVGFLTSSSTTRLYRGRVPKLASDNFTCCHTRDRVGNHEFCFSWSHYTDTDPTIRERAATTGIEPRTSSPGVPWKEVC